MHTLEGDSYVLRNVNSYDRLFCKTTRRCNALFYPIYYRLICKKATICWSSNV